MHRSIDLSWICKLHMHHILLAACELIICTVSVHPTSHGPLLKRVALEIIVCAKILNGESSSFGPSLDCAKYQKNCMSQSVLDCQHLAVLCLKLKFSFGCCVQTRHTDFLKFCVKTFFIVIKKMIKKIFFALAGKGQISNFVTN